MKKTYAAPATSIGGSVVLETTNVSNIPQPDSLGGNQGGLDVWFGL